MLIEITLGDVEFFGDVRDVARRVTQRLRTFGGVRLQRFQAVLDSAIDQILLGIEPDLLDDQREQLARLRDLVKRPDDSGFVLSSALTAGLQWVPNRNAVVQITRFGPATVALLLPTRPRLWSG